MVDLSWEFTETQYTRRSEPSVTVATLENEDYNLSTLVMGTQTGTHVDAPSFSNSGEAIDVSSRLTWASVVRVTDKKVANNYIRRYRAIRRNLYGKIVLFNSAQKQEVQMIFHHPYKMECTILFDDNGVRFIGMIQSMDQTVERNFILTVIL
ncbi:MAG: cyclase family protein [Anaerobutyricum sp.]